MRILPARLAAIGVRSVAAKLIPPCATQPPKSEVSKTYDGISFPAIKLARRQGGVGLASHGLAAKGTPQTKHPAGRGMRMT